MSDEMGEPERDVWAEPKAGDVVTAGPGYGMLVVHSVTDANVMAQNPLRAMFGAKGAQRRIPLEAYRQLGDSSWAEVHSRAEDDEEHAS